MCIAQSRDMRNTYKSWVLVLSYHGFGRMIILRLHEKYKDKKLILIIKASKMHCFSNLELYMFWTDLLSIIRSFNTVYRAIGICHASYVDCLLASRQ